MSKHWINISISLFTASAVLVITTRSNFITFHPLQPPRAVIVCILHVWIHRHTTTFHESHSSLLCSMLLLSHVYPSKGLTLENFSLLYIGAWIFYTILPFLPSPPPPQKMLIVSISFVSSLVFCLLWFSLVHMDSPLGQDTLNHDIYYRLHYTECTELSNRFLLVVSKWLFSSTAFALFISFSLSRLAA